MSERDMLTFSHVSCTYEGQERPSIRDVTLCVERGACVLVTGPSGSGKSTLVRLANGLVPHYFRAKVEGSVRACGKDPAQAALWEQAHLTGSVFQNPRTQFYTTDTTSELAFSLENQGLPADVIIRRIEEVVNRQGLGPLMDRSLFELSGGEKQRIACASVEVADPGLVLLDEPTANLDADGSAALAQLVRAWKEQGKTIVIAEHRLSWVIDVVDTLVVLEKGAVVAELRGEEARHVDEGFCAEHGLRTPRATPRYAMRVPVAQPARQGPATYVENLHFAREKGHLLLDFDRLDLVPGGVTAVVGRNGRGKTTLLRCLAGLEPHDRSVLHHRGEAWGRKKRLGSVFLVAQDVNCQIFTQNVREEVTLSLAAGADEGLVDEALVTLDLEDVGDRDPFTLSGGQRQRVAIACAVVSGRDVICFDEPTSGLGYAHMRRFAVLLHELTERGRTVVVVTHDDELVDAVADGLVVL